MRMIYWKASLSAALTEAIASANGTLEGITAGETILLRTDGDEVERVVESVQRHPEYPNHITVRFASLKPKPTVN